jgi:hypothetical protein
MKNEIQKNNLIHNELENKITEILKFLPEEESYPEKEQDEMEPIDIKPASKTISFDDEIPVKISDEPIENEVIKESLFVSDKKETATNNDQPKSVIETEEEMLKKFVQEQQDINNVFNMEAKNFPELGISQEEKDYEDPASVNTFPGMDNDNGVQIKNDVKINDELFDKDAEEIEFNFEDRQNDDLPKGVL